MGEKRKAEEPERAAKKAKKEKKEKKEKEEKKEETTTTATETVRVCVPIAKPLSEDTENLTKKILSLVKYATKNKTMVRGIKEVTKLVRKKKVAKNSLVVLAADISPLDVIAHMPVLLDDEEVRYMWVPSRSDLGASTLSKRPTSAVLIKKVPEDKQEAFEKVLKVVAKEHKSSK